ncbi:uncharacterized protein LOC117330622 [Pecten maximus]|uniref:uncharacterized protein LOC117330622 n=1 Tax=Pecten maximus TaxID=6579 RepID=UPI00145840AB|nr:uncharacterized protein LOC117330622 [Pecten maximus]XP_033744941.1 uncharacterized protein LOC117330622 [Pecten maximus]
MRLRKFHICRTLHPKHSSSDLKNTPSTSASYNVAYSTSSPDTPPLQPMTVSSAGPQSKRPTLSTSVTPDVVTSKMATVTSPSFGTTGDRCTKCIEVVFNLRVTIKDKQTEQEFQVSVQTAFSMMLTRFYGHRFRRDLRNATNPQRNSTHFLPSDVHIRNTTSMGNIVVLLLEVKHPLGDFVHNQYLEYLLQKSEARLSLEQDLSVYGATLTEFSVPDNPSTDTPRPGDESGATSIFAQHFGLFLTVIILSSFVACAGVIAMIYLRNKARTGMWYCPSGTRYAKQLERTLLTKTTNWRVGHMTNPIPDVDILHGEDPMTETTEEENSSHRASCTGDRTSREGSCPEVDTWVVPLGDGMDEGLADEEYDTRL